LRPQRYLYLDQNAWIGLAKGAWSPAEFPREHTALSTVTEAVDAHRVLVPLSFTNIYETFKINDPVRREHLAHVQSSISAGWVLRSRRSLFGQTLAQYLAATFSLPVAPLPERWFLSDLWIEAAADYTPEQFGLEISNRLLGLMRANPAVSLFHYLAGTEEEVRAEGVRRYSASSRNVIAGLEKRRGRAAGETLAVRKRAYGATLLIDEFEFILGVARELGLQWQNVSDIGSSLARKLMVEVPVLDVERELAIRIEDQMRPINENDLRDMTSFTTALPLADVMVAEKAFINMARQAQLGERYQTLLLSSISALTPEML
jgi:hypothetical protein